MRCAQNGQHSYKAMVNKYSRSNIEEVIACLWAIIFLILYYNNAPTPLLFFVGLKALFDFICSVIAAIQNVKNKKHDQ